MGVLASGKLAKGAEDPRAIAHFFLDGIEATKIGLQSLKFRR